MAPEPPTNGKNEEFWREFPTHPDSLMSFGRRYFSRLPSGPRCRQCGAPFHGPVGPVMRLIGKGPSNGNPNICNSCYRIMTKHHGGAEVEGSLLFADIRGSTELGERMSPADFHALLERFYAAASAAVFAHDGIVDKFVGDELVATFPPMLSDTQHPKRAVACAVELLRITGHGDAGGPWVPVGAGVHTGRVWFGAVGTEGHTELTVLGDGVNTTARLAAAARAGEVLVTAAAAEAARLDPALPRRTLELKGKDLPVEVVTLGVAAVVGA